MSTTLSAACRKAAFIFLIASAALFSWAEISGILSHDSPEKKIRQAEQNLAALEGLMTETLEGAITAENFHDYFHGHGYRSKGLSFYVQKNGQAVYWTNHEPVINQFTLDSLRSRTLLSLPNGLYLAYVRLSGVMKVTGLMHIKNEYAYENRYLKNSFNDDLGLDDFIITQNRGTPFHAPGGEVLFHLEGNDSPAHASHPWLSVIAAALGFLSFFLYGCSLTKPLQVIRLILVAIALRALMIIFTFPEGLYSTGFFSPQHYASSYFFNSLGDFILNALVFFVSAMLLFRIRHHAGATTKYAMVFLCILYVLSVHFLLHGLVINSQLTLDVSRLTTLDIYSIAGFATIAVLLISVLYVFGYAIRIISGLRPGSRLAWAGVVLAALYASLLVNSLNIRKEKDNRKLLAQKVELTQDHVAEYFFDETSHEISLDPDVAQILENAGNPDDLLTTHISGNHFRGYLAKFDVKAIGYRANGNSNPRQVPLSYYLDLAERGKETYSDNLFFLSNPSGRSSYIAILPVGDIDDTLGTIVLLIESKFFQSESGFPELFLSNSGNDPPGEYSYARYTGGALIYEYGDYIYSFSPGVFGESEGTFTFVDLNDWNHLVYRLSANSFIVISQRDPGLFAVLTLFSWLFTLLTVLLALSVLALMMTGTGFRWSVNLTQRVQGSVIVLVILSFVMVCAGTVYYISGKYDSDQRKSISDQVNALWFLISENLPAGLGDAGKTEQIEALEKLVENTNTDFNIYDANGVLYFSSQPKIFERGIVSARMNPRAYFGMKATGVTQYIQPESVGSLRYIAAYAPFTDRMGNITAYLNLPYFEKQNELNREVAGLLSALINIYVLLFALAVIVTLFISGRITKPLLLIQEKMAAVKLGIRNEQIRYERKDEIGQLVDEYNRMVDELGVSAEKLAQSERESAWREMARQVAHEIKNPLTPMKLSVQHMQRIMKEQGEGREELVERISKTMIHQIDTLANIASAFSDFAKMPKASPVNVDLKEVLKDVINLYSESRNVEFVFSAPEESCKLFADRDQLSRIFSNLVANAIQAIPDDRVGKISVRLSREGTAYHAEVADNGIGIAEDQVDKIFTPNFTTKSGGMGLGLAMVKNLVEQLNGRIWFSTTYGEGSSFHVVLPSLVS